MHFFSSLALTLNEPEEGVAPTDSRLRPDQRLMEAGLWDEANAQKQRLEEHQRLERKRKEVQANQALEEGETKETNKNKKDDRDFAFNLLHSIDIKTDDGLINLDLLWLEFVCLSTGNNKNYIWIEMFKILRYNIPFESKT